MAINGQNAAAVKALVTGATTTEADFRTGTDHIIDQVDASEQATSVRTKIYNSSGNYVVPNGVTKLMITGTGAGGGGGGGRRTNYNNTAIGGGQGAYSYRTEISVTAGSTYVVTLGTGGAAGTDQNQSTPSAGSAGNATSFGNVITFNGGAGGNHANATANSSAGGTVSGGTANNVSAGILSGLANSMKQISHISTYNIDKKNIII